MPFVRRRPLIRRGGTRLPVGADGPAPGEYDANVPSTNVHIEIDPGSPVPLHEQVAGALRRAIAQGGG